MNKKKIFLAAILLGSSIGLAALAEDLQIESVTSTASLVLIPQTNWTATVDSQEISDVSQNTCCAPTPGSNAIDGNPNTFWNTEWFNNQPGFPHEIVVDMGASYSVAGFRHLPRQDGVINGRLKEYEFYVSDDPNNWGTAIVTDTLPNTDQPTDVIFSGGPVVGRYVRLVGHSNYSLDSFSESLGELGVWTDDGSPTPTPSPTPTATPEATSTPTATPESTATATPVPTPIITGQPQNQTVNVGQTATFSVTATGPGTLSYKWKKNGKPVGGPASNGSSYTTPATTLNDNGSAFTCTVSNAGGSVTSNAAILTVLGATPTPTASPTPTATPTATPTPSPTPTVTPTATPTPTPTPNGVPVATISAAPTALTEGQRATITISLSPVNPTQSTIVNFVVTGNAKFGTDYSLTANGSIVVPPGTPSGTIILTSFIDHKTEKTEKTTITLSPGAGYAVSNDNALNKTTITISDGVIVTSGHRRHH